MKTGIENLSIAKNEKPVHWVKIFLEFPKDIQLLILSLSLEKKRVAVESYRQQGYDQPGWPASQEYAYYDERVNNEFYVEHWSFLILLLFINDTRLTQRILARFLRQPGLLEGLNEFYSIKAHPSYTAWIHPELYIASRTEIYKGVIHLIQDIKDLKGIPETFFQPILEEKLRNCSTLTYFENIFSCYQDKMASYYTIWLNMFAKLLRKEIESSMLSLADLKAVFKNFNQYLDNIKIKFIQYECKNIAKNYPDCPPDIRMLLKLFYQYGYPQNHNLIKSCVYTLFGDLEGKFWGKYGKPDIENRHLLRKQLLVVTQNLQSEDELPHFIAEVQALGTEAQEHHENISGSFFWKANPLFVVDCKFKRFTARIAESCRILSVEEPSDGLVFPEAEPGPIQDKKGPV